MIQPARAIGDAGMGFGRGDMLGAGVNADDSKSRPE